MNLLIAVLGTAGLGSVVWLSLILARLTKKWEVVTKSRSLYRLLNVGAALIALASLTRLVRIGYLYSSAGPSAFHEPESWFYLCFYYIPLVVGAGISLVVTWRNWGWLLSEDAA
jgi:hypothetical protein